MTWEILFCDEFEQEFLEMALSLQDELLAHLHVLAAHGPSLGRPLVDTLKGSRHRHMKELRFFFNSRPYRFFFAFDPKRQGIVLVGGDKGGDKRFYKRRIPVADERYDNHLQSLKEA